MGVQQYQVRKEFSTFENFPQQRHPVHTSVELSGFATGLQCNTVDPSHNKQFVRMNATYFNP